VLNFPLKNEIKLTLGIPVNLDDRRLGWLFAALVLCFALGLALWMFGW